jgi:hypothetical protein
VRLAWRRLCASRPGALAWPGASIAETCAWSSGRPSPDPLCPRLGARWRGGGLIQQPPQGSLPQPRIAAGEQPPELTASVVRGRSIRSRRRFSSPVRSAASQPRWCYQATAARTVASSRFHVVGATARSGRGTSWPSSADSSPTAVVGPRPPARLSSQVGGPVEWSERGPGGSREASAASWSVWCRLGVARPTPLGPSSAVAANAGSLSVPRGGDSAGGHVAAGRSPQQIRHLLRETLLTIGFRACPLRPVRKPAACSTSRSRGDRQHSGKPTIM